MAAFGHIDANVFYCSAEQAFDPSLRGLPLVVLSNNDGCAIARTAEAKRLGVTMGVPWYQVARDPGMVDVQWLSSNYTLYADMSRRIYQVLSERVPGVEPYSIDEFFLDLDSLPGSLDQRCRTLRADVLRITKIPTCLGVGPTKTIAKLANKLAKDDQAWGGLCDLSDPGLRKSLYPETPVSKAWGIGSAAARKLRGAGISSLGKFVRTDPRQVRALLTIAGVRTQAELLGLSCIPLRLTPSPRRSTTSSRSFSRPLESFEAVREAVSFYTVKAAEKVRRSGMVAGRISVFVHTNPHSSAPWYAGELEARIAPTNNSVYLIQEARRLLETVWRPGHHYVKAGVMLSGLLPGEQAPSLFPYTDPIRAVHGMDAIDRINERFGRDRIQPLATGLDRPWLPRAAKRSPRYTTRLCEILVASSW